VFGVGEFRALWIAHAQSRLGDQLARVAIAVLVFSRTSSALLTSLTYALTFLPPLVSAPLLSGLADRYPRRSVLVVTDLCRATLVGVMAIPAVPLAGIVPLLVVMVSLQPLYSAARNAMLPNILEGDRYTVGLGLADVTDSIAQVSGFALGGMLLELVSSHAVLGFDAATFVLSALLVRWGTRPNRPVREHTGPDPEPRRSVGGSIAGGVALVWGDARLRTLALLAWLYGFFVAPEGVAAPYARQLQGSAAVVGLLMAADPIGAGIGAVVVSRWVRPTSRPRLIGPLAMLTGVPLVLSAVHPRCRWRSRCGRSRGAWAHT
jgi:predicted MFS family arabinose efflux permease